MSFEYKGRKMYTTGEARIWIGIWKQNADFYDEAYLYWLSELQKATTLERKTKCLHEMDSAAELAKVYRRNVVGLSKLVAEIVSKRAQSSAVVIESAAEVVAA